MTSSSGGIGNNRKRSSIPVEFGFGSLILTLTYFLTIHHFKDSHHLVPAEEYCAHSEQNPCSRPDLFAFQLSSGIAIGYVAYLGFHTWYVSKRVHNNLPNTPEGRLFGYLEESESIAVANFTFQTWDFIISLLIPEHCTVLFLAHHLMAAAISYFSFSYQVLHYYGIYFLGLTEVSSCFLVIIDLGRYFPPDSGSFFRLVVSICEPAFLITFGLYRIVLWWKVSYLLWSDVLYVVRTGKAEELRPGTSWILKYVYLPSNILLGILQLYWFDIILIETKKVLFGHEMPHVAQGTE